MKRILIAEDVEEIALLMRHTLESAGYAVEVAADGEACVEKALAALPDLVILDIMMPKLHGLDALKRLKAAPSLKQTVFIICSAKEYKPDIDRALELGASAVIGKPFDPEELIRVVGNALTRKVAPVPARTVSPLERYRPPKIASGLGFRLWGTRGSIPVSSPTHLRHGGNTTCASFECGEDLVVIDAGTGIRELGLELARAGPRRIHLFISHTHWDHIQGFPFFAPVYIPGFEIHVHAASGYGRDIHGIFRDQLDRDFFPVQMQEMRARLVFSHLGASPMRIGSLSIHWEFTHHPSAALGFRIEAADRSIAFVCDNEYMKGWLGHPKKALEDPQLVAAHSKIVTLATGVDLLIAEAQYTNEEYPSKIGWGHSSVSNACLFAVQAKVGRWIVVHHDPMHDDAFLQEKLVATRAILRELGEDIEVENGFDGMTGVAL